MYWKSITLENKIEVHNIVMQFFICFPISFFLETNEKLHPYIVDFYLIFKSHLMTNIAMWWFIYHISALAGLIVFLLLLVF